MDAYSARVGRCRGQEGKIGQRKGPTLQACLRGSGWPLFCRNVFRAVKPSPRPGCFCEMCEGRHRQVDCRREDLILQRLRLEVDARN